MDAAVIRGLACAAAALGAAILAPPATAAWTPAQDIGPGLPGLSAAAVSPQVVIDGRGDVLAVWSRCESAGCAVLAAHRPAGGAWSAPQTLGPGSSSSAIRVALNATGDVVVAWIGGEVRAAVRPAGGTWTPAQAMQFATPDPGYQPPTAGTLAVAIDPAGDATLLWSENFGGPIRGFPGYHVLRSSRRPAGGDWEPPREVERSGAWPAVAVDASGTALAVWLRSVLGQFGMTTSYEMRSASWPPGGDWSPSEVVATPGVFNPSRPIGLWRDAGGGLVADWDDGLALNVVRRPAGGAWGPTKSMPLVGHEASAAGVDGGGTLTGIWDSFGFGSPILATTQPPGGGFAPAVEVMSGAGSRYSFQPALAVAPAGGAVAAWRQWDQAGYDRFPYPFRHGAMAAVRSPDGKWGTPEFLVGPGQPDEILAEHPAAAIDDAGRAATVWSGGYGQMQAALRDPNPPAFSSVAVPAQAAAGAPVALAAAVGDDFSGLAGPPAWDLGDGATADGASVTHAWSAPGTYTVAVTVADAAGNVARAERGIVVAPRPPAPDAATGAARAICATRAVLTGSIDGHGLAATARFAYGTRSTNRTTPARAVAAGTTRQGVRESVQGLRPGTRYVVRVVAESTGGATPGAARSFRTPPARLGPWRTAPRAVPKGYRLVRLGAGGGIRYVARARPC